LLLEPHSSKVSKNPMKLAEGEKLGPYKILSAIGAGGMGEVYRATDTRLQREVAIKTSAEQFTDRFEREARVIASLSHPNICTLYDVGPNYLVMELVAGPTLAERIAQGPIPLDEALGIATQIADALAAAHANGIVHRDLKPGNIKITPGGVVKVLDFGLAKAGAVPMASLDNSPTLSLPRTEAGYILGTAAYMSPEQAKGRPVDKRADIWAFGVVLYEMLTGRRLFHGETVSETLASVLKEEPSLDRIPAKAQRLLRSCLQKDPNQRLHDIADWKLLLEDAPRLQSPPSRTRLLWPAIAAVFLVIAAVLAFVHFREQVPLLQLSRFHIPLPDQLSVVNTPFFALSPDGRYLAFEAGDSTGVRIWLHSMESLEARPLTDTNLANFVRPIFWSPDSRFVAFDVGGKLKKIDIAGGPAQTICDLPFPSVGASWNRDGVIILGSANGLLRVSASGGLPTPITKPDPSRGDAGHIYPVFLPDGKHFLYVRATNPGPGGIYSGSLDDKPEAAKTNALVPSGFGFAYVPSMDRRKGQLLYMQQGTLMAHTFDHSALKLVGDPVQVVDGVGTVGAFSLFSASANGDLIYKTGPNQELQLTWIDRQGKVLGTVGELGRYNFMALSPDAQRVVVSRINSQSGNSDLWLIDLASGSSTRLTFDKATGVRQAAWAPDGAKIVFLSNRDGVGGFYQKATNGAGSDELVFKGGQGLAVNQWSRDGRFLIFGMADPETKNDLWLLPMAGERKPIPWIRSPFNETGGRISPDGRWVAYRSDESGRNDVYVQPFNSSADSGTSAAAGKWMVSRGSLGMARWREDSKELYYLTPDAKVMMLDVTANPAFHAGVPTVLFQVPPVFLRGAAFPGTLGDVTPDGKRFLFAMPAVQSGPEQFTVVLNWQAGLRK
jgi:eukaryotic-like serine/threonine-protein kinase